MEWCEGRGGREGGYGGSGGSVVEVREGPSLKRKRGVCFNRIR